MPTVSFVVIAYNVERYVAACLRSIKAQTSSDYEVIVVDDASTDGSLGIIRQEAAGDSRFTIIAKPHNEGAHLARRTGVARTRGKYVIFVDGDDCVQSTACEVLTGFAANRDFDILRFGRFVIPHGKANEAGALREEYVFNQTSGNQHSADILRSVFSEDFPVRNTWSLIDCMFRGDFVRPAFARMTTEPLGRMQDSYEFFVLADHADTMLFFTEYRGLRYNFGAGVSGAGMESLQRFEKGHNGIHSSMSAVMAYAAQAPDHGPYDSAVNDCAQWYKHTVLGIVGREWVSRLSEADQAAGMESLRRLWGDENAAYMLLDPLVARAQWFVDNDAIPSPEDPYSRWLAIFESLKLDDVSDSAIKARIARFTELRGHIEAKAREILLQKQAEEMERLLERQRKELIARQLEEQQRILKTGSPARAVVDKLFPEGGAARNCIRSVTRHIMGR